MDKLITVSVTYTLKVHPTSQEPGRGRFELINSDGVRECWCNSVSEAEEYAREDVEDGMNLSGGMGLGYVNITTTDLK